jgi:hypothetical protein
VVLEFVSEKQKRIVRSTFAAGLQAILDAMSAATLVNLVFAEVMSHRAATPLQLASCAQSGRLAFPVDVFTDARTVLDTAMSRTAKTPAEQHLHIHVLALREAMESGVTLVWAEARDMLADGQTKGAVDRDPLVESSAMNNWKFIGQAARSSVEDQRSPDPSRASAHLMAF